MKSVGHPLSSVTPNRMRKNKRKSGKAGGVVRHSGWHSTWKAREAQIAAGTLIQGDPEVENDVKTSTVLREQQVDKMKKEETKDLIGYLNFLSSRTNTLESNITHHIKKWPSNDHLSGNEVSQQGAMSRSYRRQDNPNRPKTSPVGSFGQTSIRRERPALGRTDVHKKGYTAKNRVRQRKRPLTSLQKREKLALDEHGLPIVTTLELKDEPLPFDAQVSRFLTNYVKHQLKPKTSIKIQKWYRGIRVRRKFVIWQQRKMAKKEDVFTIWKLSWKFRKLSHNSKQRRYFAAWKEDHDDLKATKRLLEKAMKKDKSKSRNILANLMSFQDMASHSGNASDYSDEQMKLMEDIRFEAMRQRKSKAFLAWTRAVEYTKVNAEKARLHLRRVMRSIESQRQRYMWPVERCSLLLKLWRRIVRFDKYVKNGGDGLPEFKDLPHLKEWDDWLAEYERWQIIYFKADSLAPLVLMRRYLLRMKQFLDDIKDERNKVKNAKVHYKMYLVKRCLLSWRVEARQRGRNMRKLRKIMFTWLAWAKREKELKKRESLISARLHDKALGSVLMQWRWRRSAHSMVVTAGMHFLLQSSSKYTLLYSLFKWKGDVPHCTMMHCWRQWTQFASRRVLWNRYLFQYRRRIARYTLNGYLTRWRSYTSKRIASRRQRKRERYLAETGDATVFDDEDSESLTSDEDAAPEELITQTSVNWFLEWRKRSKNADSKLRGLKEGALPEDRLDEMVMRRMLIDTNEMTSFSSNRSTSTDSQSAPLTTDRAGNSPLHIASRRGDASSVRKLISDGHPVNVTNYRDETPLHCAAKHLPLMFLPVVIHLLESGASIAMQDTNGKTPIDVAINPQISFLLRRHKQRLEHFEFTSKERQWYRRMRINQWETVNHTELWQEVVHLLVLQKHEQIDQLAGVGNISKSSGRPQSKRSRAGGISDARMERIRRIQKSAHSSDDSGTTIIGESHFSTDGNRINVDEPTGWYSPRCRQNQWSHRYQRALAFLRTRRALDNSGYKALVESQLLKRNRRIRRLRRRLHRDKLLLSNAYLRKTVREYEKAALQQRYIDNARITEGDKEDVDVDDANVPERSGSDTDSDVESKSSSVADSEYNNDFSQKDVDPLINGISTRKLDGVSVTEIAEADGIVPLPSLTDVDSRPNTPAVIGENSIRETVPVVSMSAKKKKPKPPASKYGMVLEEANKVVGDSLRWDTDEDSDMEDDIQDVHESTSSLLDVGKVQRRSQSSIWENKDTDDLEVDDVDEDDHEDIGVINVDAAFKGALNGLNNGAEKDPNRFSSEQDVNLIRFEIEKKLTSFSGMSITVTAGLNEIPRSTEDFDRLQSIATARPNSNSGRPRSRGKEEQERSSTKSIDGMDPEYFSQLKKAHAKVLSMLEAERKDLENRWDSCDHEIQNAEADVINDEDSLNDLFDKRESVVAELTTVIKYAKKEAKNMRKQIKQVKHQAFEAEELVESLTSKMKHAKDDLSEANQSYALACKRRQGPEKVKKAQSAKENASKRVKDLTKKLQTAKESAVALDEKVAKQSQLNMQMQKMNQSNTQVHLNLLAEVDKQLSTLKARIERNRASKRANIRELQSLEMQLHEVKIEQGRQQASFSDADKSENELLQGPAGSRYRRYGTTTPPSTPPLSRGSVTALTMVLEEPHLQSQLHEEGQNEDLTTNDESVEILPDEAVLSSRSTASNKSVRAATEEKSFLLAPPKRKRPPKSSDEFKQENKEILRAKSPEAKAEIEEISEIKAKHAVLKEEHPYLSTPPQKKRQDAMNSYKDSVEILFGTERIQQKEQMEQLAMQRAKKQKEEERSEKKKKRRSEMESSLKASESNFDVFAVAKRKQAKLDRKAAAKKKEQQLQKSSDVTTEKDDVSESESDSDDEWRKGWKDDVVYAQLLAEKHNGNFAEKNNKSAASQDSGGKGASKETFYFGNIGVLIKSDNDVTLGMPKEDSVLSLDNDEAASKDSNKKSGTEAIASLASADFEPDSTLQNGDEVGSDSGSDEFSDEEPVDWRASEFPNEMFQDPLETSDGKPKEVDPSLFMLGASISVKKAEKCGVDPLKFIARDSGKRAGLARGNLDVDETDEVESVYSSPRSTSITTDNEAIDPDTETKSKSQDAVESAVQSPHYVSAGAMSTQDMQSTQDEHASSVLQDPSPDIKSRKAPIAAARSPGARSSEAADLMFGSKSINSIDIPDSAMVKECNSNDALPTAEDVTNIEINAWDESVDTQGLLIQESTISNISKDTEIKPLLKQTQQKEIPLIHDEGSVSIAWYDSINIRANKLKEDFQQRVKDDKAKILQMRNNDELKRKTLENGEWARMPIPDPEPIEQKRQAAPLRATMSQPALEILVKEDKKAMALGTFVLEGCSHSHKPITESFVVKSMSTPGLLQRQMLKQSLHESSRIEDQDSSDPQHFTLNANQNVNDLLESISYAGDEQDAWSAYFDEQNVDEDALQDSVQHNVDSRKSNALEVIGFGKGNRIEKRLNSAIRASRNIDESATRNKSTRASTAPSSPIRQAKGLGFTSADTAVAYRQGPQRPSSSSFRLEGGLRKPITNYLQAFDANINDMNLSKSHSEVVEKYANATGQTDNALERTEAKRHLVKRRSRSRGKALNTSSSLAGLKPLFLAQDSTSRSQLSSTDSIKFRPLPMTVLATRPTFKKVDSKSALDSGLSSHSSSLVKPKLPYSVGSGNSSSLVNASTNITPSIVDRYETKLPGNIKRDDTKTNDQRVEMFNGIAKTKRRAKSAKLRSKLYLKGEKMHQKDDKDLDEAESLTNYFEEQKAREEIWEKYTKRNMSMAMKAAYAELYPEIYGNDAPNTTELIQAIDPFDAYNDRDIHRQSKDEFREDKVEINEWNPVTDETNGDSSAEQDMKSRSLDDITKRERQAQYENERLESELMRLSSREKIYEDTKHTKCATDDHGRDLNNLSEKHSSKINDNSETGGIIVLEKSTTHVEATTKNERLIADRSYKASNDLDFKHQGSVMTNAQIRVSKKLINAEVSRESIPSKQIYIAEENNDHANTGRSTEQQGLIKRTADSETDRDDIAEENVDKVHETAQNLIRNNESMKVATMVTSVEREAQECIPAAVEYCVDLSPDSTSVDFPVVQDVTEPNVEVGEAIPQETQKSNASSLNNEQPKTQPIVLSHEKLPTEKPEAMVIIDGDLKQETSDISHLIKEEIHDNLSEPTSPPHSRLSNNMKSENESIETYPGLPDDENDRELEGVVAVPNASVQVLTTLDSGSSPIHDVEQNDKSLEVSEDLQQDTSTLLVESPTLNTKTEEPKYVRSVAEKGKIKNPWDKGDFGINSDAHKMMIKTMRITEDLRRQKQLEIERQQAEEMRKEEERILAEEEASRKAAEQDENRLLNLFSRDSDQVNLQYDSRRRTNLMKDIQLGRKLGEIFKINDENRKQQKKMLIKTSNSDQLAERLKAGVSNLNI